MADDEAHFLKILAITGEPNAARLELWQTVLRSLDEKDGQRRVRDLVAAMVPVETPGGLGHMVYPGRDERVLRVVRKIIRGLCHHHDIESAVANERVSADIMKYVVPQELLDSVPGYHREPDIAEYRFFVWSDDDESPDNLCAWLLTFYERITFIGWVRRT